jgi:cation diffusion facilitator CzcD-associated flavoprotein CzcO
VHFYSLSTDLNPYWEKTHGTQPALQSYWKHLADKYALLQHTVFNAEVLSAEWDAGLQLYSLVVCDVPSGQIKIVQAQVVVAAIGVFG